MAFVGDKNGPRMSEIIRSLGHSYFGITAAHLEEEIQWCEKYERDGVVDPVFKDADGKYFLLFNVPAGKTQRFYLEENGYILPDKPEKAKYENK